MRLVFLLAAVASSASSGPSGTPPHTTRATLSFPAPPAQLAEVLTNYAAWPATFTDVERVMVDGSDAAHARVKFKSRSLQRDLTLQFDNVPGHVRFTIVDGPGGLIGWGSTTLTSDDAGGTVADTALFIHVPALDALPLSHLVVDRMRERKFQRDADDLMRHFSPPQAITVSRK